MQIPPPFALERYFGRYEFSAPPHMLSAADCETWSAGDLFALEEGSLDDFCSMRFGYTESQGDPTLREEISDLSGGDIGPDRCVVFAGAEEAIYITMHALLSPGDHVVILSPPAYQSLHEVPPRHIGADVSYWQMKEESGWRPDMAELWSLIRPETKCIVINTPHNPTGSIFLQQNWTKSSGLQRRRAYGSFQMRYTASGGSIAPLTFSRPLPHGTKRAYRSA